jgi:hypothetical protein
MGVERLACTDAAGHGLVALSVRSPCAGRVASPLEARRRRTPVNPSADACAAFLRRWSVRQDRARGIVLAPRQRAHEPSWRAG